ncbi:hypothetical protein BZA05DRAFT_50815 [Tricharina praecox]|uniref:uncharacterized protein n=1 Tax=Tricharina praecox TaxID=43433 RepID=UPI002220D04C|nr:uncharacterized protein BZA05DRAFT_50815 [Tricharina praecox]KAI5850832.1 hypothetical protein BZA05DRAFT_50815 [Tricharina praecox]
MYVYTRGFALALVVHFRFFVTIFSSPFSVGFDSISFFLFSFCLGLFFFIFSFASIWFSGLGYLYCFLLIPLTTTFYACGAMGCGILWDMGCEMMDIYI